MVRGNPAALLWINHKAKRIWKKNNSSKDGKYKKAHKEAAVAYCKKHPTTRSNQRRRNELALAILQIMPLFFV